MNATNAFCASIRPSKQTDLIFFGENNYPHPCLAPCREHKLSLDFDFSRESPHHPAECTQVYARLCLTFEVHPIKDAGIRVDSKIEICWSGAGLIPKKR